MDQEHGRDERSGEVARRGFHQRSLRPARQATPSCSRTRTLSRPAATPLRTRIQRARRRSSADTTAEQRPGRRRPTRLATLGSSAPATMNPGNDRRKTRRQRTQSPTARRPSRTVRGRSGCRWTSAWRASAAGSAGSGVAQPSTRGVTVRARRAPSPRRRAARRRARGSRSRACRPANRRSWRPRRGSPRHPRRPTRRRRRA